jgi:Flp pilus assembly pilin Flp
MSQRWVNRVLPGSRKGSIFVEYILLATIVGIGVIVGLACIRESLNNELVELATAINAIVP